MTKTDAMYRAALIGLGAVATGYDGGSGKPALTHLSALRENHRVRTVAACSPSADERRAFCSLVEGAFAYDSVFAMLEAQNPDLVSICSPSELHFEHALACIDAGVPMIWLEKPPVLALSQGELLLEAARRRGTTILVGYQRRCAEPFVSLRPMIENGSWGGLSAITVHYSLKLYRNGCHGLDALFFLLGEPQAELQAVFAGEDPETPSFMMDAGGVPVAFIGLPGSFHSLEFSFSFRRAQLLILNGGRIVMLRDLVDDPLYATRWLDIPKAAPDMSTSYDNNGMSASLADLIKSYEEGGAPASSLETALRTQRIMEAVMERLRK